MREKWLDTILELARMKPAQLAASAELDEGLISRLRKTSQRPTFETLEAISKATKIPLVTIYEAVGYLPESSDDDRDNQRVLHLLKQLSPEEREKEIRRLELNVELSNGNKTARVRTKTNHSRA